MVCGRGSGNGFVMQIPEMEKCQEPRFQLVADLRKKGQSFPIIDSMIAATALTHGLTVATHNVRDFQKAGVSVLDPFA